MSPVPTAIRTLGPAGIPSPRRGPYVPDDERILLDPRLAAVKDALARGEEPASFEAAGPRARLRLAPAGTRAGILTAGGLCPGINDVIRALVMELWHGHGVRDILGLSYGYDGLLATADPPPRALVPDLVAEAHEDGGTILGTCRGRHEPAVLAERIRALGLRALFAVGGDGTLKGLAALEGELAARGIECALVGVPKTIDNDILWCVRTFGFETAVAQATRTLRAAHAEARGHQSGVGLVKLMGRDSGFIAAAAALAHPEANVVLVPEVDFDLDGPGGLLEFLETRLDARRHAVVVVAEGAGQRHLQSEPRVVDASGNVKHADVGRFLERRIQEHFASRGRPLVLKYLDPSYEIRSAPAVPGDKVFCGTLARHAVHAAMSGRTGLMIGYWSSAFVHVPLEAAIASRKRIDPSGPLWQALVATTGQPPLRNGS